LKTVEWWLSAVSWWCLTSAAPGALFLVWEEDLRGVATDWGKLDGEINSLGGSMRAVWADRQGDRIILFVRAETAHNLSEFLVHEAYGQLKGPMGRWNLTLGRVRLPWGLLTDWSPDRLPHNSPYTGTRMLDSDNGLGWHGTVGSWDYGLALTQGYGMQDVEEFPGPGLVTGRIGFTPDESGDITVGLSLSGGTVHSSEERPHESHGIEEKRIAASLDGTLRLGRGVYRFEGGARRTQEEWRATAFVTADYALMPKTVLQFAGQLYQTDKSDATGWVYAGLAVPLASVTIRVGYQYEPAETDQHKVVVQLYRYMAVSR